MITLTYNFQNEDELDAFINRGKVVNVEATTTDKPAKPAANKNKKATTTSKKTTTSKNKKPAEKPAKKVETEDDVETLGEIAEGEEGVLEYDDLVSALVPYGKTPEQRNKRKSILIDNFNIKRLTDLEPAKRQEFLDMVQAEIEAHE